MKKDVIHKRLVASLLAGVITVSSIGGVSLLASTSYADDSNKETTQVSSSKDASSGKSSKSTGNSSKSSKNNKSKTNNDRSKASKSKQNGNHSGTNGQGGPGNS